MKIIKSIKNRYILILFAIFSGNFLHAQPSLDSSNCLKYFDNFRKLFLFEVTSVNGNVQFLYFTSNSEQIEKVDVYFDTSNKLITNVGQLKEFLSGTAVKTDSTTLITCHLLNRENKKNDYHIIFCNDFACLSEFKRMNKLGNKIFDSILNSALKQYTNKPILVIKEWTCKTTQLYSIFY